MCICVGIWLWVFVGICGYLLWVFVGYLQLLCGRLMRESATSFLFTASELQELVTQRGSTVGTLCVTVAEGLRRVTTNPCADVEQLLAYLWPESNHSSSTTAQSATSQIHQDTPEHTSAVAPSTQTKHSRRYLCDAADGCLRLFRSTILLFSCCATQPLHRRAHSLANWEDEKLPSGSCPLQLEQASRLPVCAWYSLDELLAPPSSS